MQACDVGMLTRMLTRIIRSDVTHHSAIVRGDNCFHKTPKIVTMRIPVTESNTLTFKVVLDTYIMIFGDSKAEIYGFYVAAILKPQDGCHDIISGGGSYQKCEPKIMRSLWKNLTLLSGTSTSIC